MDGRRNFYVENLDGTSRYEMDAVGVGFGGRSMALGGNRKSSELRLSLGWTCREEQAKKSGYERSSELDVFENDICKTTRVTSSLTIANMTLFSATSGTKYDRLRST